MSVNIIVVGHKPNPLNTLPRIFLHEFDSVRTIWTSRSPGRFLKELNEAFEFSGYQEGLASILNQDLRAEGENNDRESKKLSIIFINDTFFNSHIRMLSTFVLKKLIRLSLLELQNTPRITGLVMCDKYGYENASNEMGYLSSWIFMVEGMPEDLGRIRFYESSTTLGDFKASIYPSLPSNYREAVNNWLSPVNFFKGWYQATPGVALPSDILDRKRYTIYLEHSMPNHFRSIGYSVHSISQALDIRSKVTLSILLFMDRIFGNLLKMRHRIFL